MPNSYNPPKLDRRSLPRWPCTASKTSDRGNARSWSPQLPEAEWRVYQSVAQEARKAGVRFAFGGAFATAVYTGELRNTKDFDFYILPEDRETMKEAIGRAGLTDYFDQLPYDRSWIYRASQGDVLVDAIWAMANQRTPVDMVWLTRGPLVEIRGERLRAIPIEELIWSKLYVLQRDRSDWGDVLNLIAAQAKCIDWEHLLARLGEDAPLLTAVLAVFSWLDPFRARGVPAAVWDRLRLPPPEPDTLNPVDPQARAALIDSRPWFRPSAQ